LGTAVEVRKGVVRRRTARKRGDKDSAHLEKSKGLRQRTSTKGVLDNTGNLARNRENDLNWTHAEAKKKIVDFSNLERRPRENLVAKLDWRPRGSERRKNPHSSHIAEDGERIIGIERHRAENFRA